MFVVAASVREASGTSERHICECRLQTSPVRLHIVDHETTQRSRPSASVPSHAECHHRKLVKL